MKKYKSHMKFQKIKNQNSKHENCTTATWMQKGLYLGAVVVAGNLNVGA